MVNVKLARPETLSRIYERIGFRGMEVYGSHDGVLEAESKNIEDLHKKVNEIDKMGLVQTTVTYIVAKETMIREFDERTFAYALIDAAPGTMEEVQSKLLKLEKIKKADIVFGPFDIIAEIAASGMNDLNQIIKKIISIESVLRTHTLISADIH
jgi:DNA-binding Lrp family transcriptional regulator